MDKISILIGELRGFKEEAIRRFDAMEEEHATLKKSIEGLNRFKWKITGASILIVGVVEFFMKLMGGKI